MKTMRGQTRLMRRFGSRNYYFRARVPVDLTEHYAPRTEFTFSLKTSDRREAERRARVESVKLDQEFEALRQRRTAEQVDELSDELIKQLSAAYVSKMLTADEGIRRRRFEFPNNSQERTHAYYSKLLDGLPRFKKQLAMGDTSYVEIGMSHFLEGFGIKLAKDSGSYRKLAYELMKAHVKAYELAALRHQGEVIDTPSAPTIASTKADPEGGMKLSEAFTAWAAERQPKAKTLLEFSLTRRRFIELNGDLRLKDIKKAHVIKLKESLLAEGKAAGTVKKQLGALRTVLQWAVSNDRLQVNPADGVKLAVAKVEKEKRLPYDADDLNKIFASAIFKNHYRPRGGGGDAAYWLPLLALLTGARLEELGQLLCADLKHADGIDYLEISDRGEGKSIKTHSSRRRVPLHPELMRLGFLEYVREPATRSERMFPELSGARFGKVTEAWSKWWGRFVRQELGITDTRKVFHSFRHGFKDACRECRIEEEVSDALTGHTGGGQGRRYGGRGLTFPLAPLAEAINRLRYTGLDLSHLNRKAVERDSLGGTPNVKGTPKWNSSSSAPAQSSE